MKLTILFEPPYWIGLLEDERDGLLYATRFIFGAEPNDPQVYEFVLNEVRHMFPRMTVGVAVESRAEKPMNPKRMQREVRRELAQVGMNTKAQEAMRLELEAAKKAREAVSREERDAKRDYKRALALQKAKDKHRGH